MKLVSTRLVTHDVSALARFYSTVTGIAAVGIEDYTEFETATGVLAICSQRGVDIFNAGAAVPAANRSVIIEFEVENVDRERSRLDRIIDEFVMEPTDQPWGNRSMLFRDPDGNLINFFSQTSAHTSGGTARSPRKPRGRRPSADLAKSILLQIKNMKTNRTIYWAITALISFFMLFSAYYSGTHKLEFTTTLGFPNYFRIELTAAKIVGALMLLVPQVPSRIREWVYVSFGIVLISAAIAKYSSGYPIIGVIEPVSVFLIMVGSTLYLNHLSRLGDHSLNHAPVLPATK